MRILGLSGITLLFFLVTITASAGVNIKNGNFYISYTDQSFKNNGGLELTRTYNSKAIEVGIFGFGWGSVIEDRLVFIGDGSIVLKNGGSGGQTEFSPAVVNQDLINQAIMQILEAMIKNKDINNSPVGLAKEKSKLLNNSDYRIGKWIKYSNKGFLKVNFKPSGIYYVPSWGNSTITFNNNTFTNHNSWGETKTFDMEGNFTSMYDKNNKLEFSIQYDHKKIKTLIDGAGNQLEFEMNENGQVLSINSSNGKSIYKYDAQNNLIESEDTGKNIFHHQYDNAHNMIRIGYTDGTNLKIAYDQTTFFVSQIINRDKSIVNYDYKNFYTADGSIDGDHYATWIFKQKTNSDAIDTSYYEYDIKSTAQGRRYNYKFIKREGNDYYESRCNPLGNPVWVKHNLKQATFKHDNLGKLIEKESAAYIMKITYNNAYHQIASTEKTFKKTGKKIIERFTYNKIECNHQNCNYQYVCCYLFKHTIKI